LAGDSGGRALGWTRESELENLPDNVERSHESKGLAERVGFELLGLF
jgi:hypothetical protein